MVFKMNFKRETNPLVVVSCVVFHGVLRKCRDERSHFLTAPFLMVDGGEASHNFGLGRHSANCFAKGPAGLSGFGTFHRSYSEAALGSI